MKITSKTIYIILVCIIVGLIIMWQCERQNAIESSQEKTRLEIENSYLYSVNNKYHKVTDSLLTVNKFLRYETDSIINIVGDMSKDQLKNLWSKYRYNLYHNK